jgi:hypothetical protein
MSSFSATLLRLLFIFLKFSPSLLPNLKHLYRTHNTLSNTCKLGVSMLTALYQRNICNCKYYFTYVRNNLTIFERRRFIQVRNTLPHYRDTGKIQAFRLLLLKRKRTKQRKQSYGALVSFIFIQEQKQE